jgi:hypothetical protein
MFSLKRIWCHHQEVWEIVGRGVNSTEWKCPTCHKKEIYMNGYTPMRYYWRCRNDGRNQAVL